MGSSARVGGGGAARNKRVAQEIGFRVGRSRPRHALCVLQNRGSWQARLALRPPRRVCTAWQGTLQGRGYRVSVIMCGCLWCVFRLQQHRLSLIRFASRSGSCQPPRALLSPMRPKIFRLQKQKSPVPWCNFGTRLSGLPKITYLSTMK